ncbi:MAG: FAD-dependent 5-carboxymethylaminomethyl-2-thiouridine(34) oxidoreductase MnmC [Planctomycetota bacterium]
MPIQPADIRFDERGNAFSAAFDDIYFNPDNAAGKTTHLFHRATGFDEQCGALRSGQPLIVGELGFGLGLNFLGTWAWFKRLAPTPSRLHYVGIEFAPPSHDQLRRALCGMPDWSAEVEALIDGWPGRVAGVHRIELPRCSLTLHLGDVDEMLPGVARGGMDAWFLDGFAPEKNPAMWSADVARQLFRLTRPGGRLGSFTAAGHVRRALADAGFGVERLPGDPFKRHILAAQRPGSHGGSHESDRDKRVVIVGAGWAGLSVADALHGRGHEVVVTDSQQPGAGASGNRQAVVSPVLDAAASPRQDFYRSAFALASRRHERCGVLRRPDTQKDAAALQKAAEVFGALDEWFDWRGDDENEEGLWMPTAGMARFTEFTAQVGSILPGAAQRWPWAVVDLQPRGEGWVLRSADGETIEADAVVLACAAAVRRFAPTSGWPLRRIRGQVSHVAATPASLGLNHVVVGEAYVCPALDGRHSVGATFDPDSDDPHERPADHEDNRRRAQQTAPRWADAMDWSTVTGRVGFRTNTPDYLPMIGPVPDVARCREVCGNAADASALTVDNLPAVPNLYAATALGSHGVITSALAGPLLADLIDAAPLPCSAHAYAAVAPARYLLRAARRRQPIVFP